MFYHDIYVLARERSIAEVNRFFAAFVPNAVGLADEYEFPEYSDQPAVIFATVTEAIQYCVDNPDAGHRFYFRSPSDSSIHAMLFFTTDRGLILGLSVLEGEEEVFAQLKEHAASDIGYITFESPPDDTAQEFQQTAAASR